MTLTLELPPDAEARLKVEAAAQGITVEEYVLRRLLPSRRPAQRSRGGRSLLAIMDSKAGPRTFTQIGDTTRYLTEERDSWER